MTPKTKPIILASPLIIIAVNFLVAYFAGLLIGKWAFIPIILIEWLLFAFFILKFGKAGALIRWLKPTAGKYGWKFGVLMIGLIPLPIFIKYNYLLAGWEIWLPWLLLALVNPWLEEFYWRGLLSDTTKAWSTTTSVLFTSLLFSINHVVFGVNALLFRGPEVLISTFVMGVVWAITYKNTHSLRWVIFSHFLVDTLNLSTPSFLDLYKPGW